MEARAEIVATRDSGNAGARRYPRALFSVPISIHMLMPGGVCTTRGVSLDVSEGGMGALVQTELKVGDVVEIEMILAKQELSAVGIVRYSSTTRCGFEFLGLVAEERRQLGEVVAGTQSHSRFGNP